MNCPLCDRELDSVICSEHHLIPKSHKGRETVLLHNICHQKIHHTFSEAELARYYNTIDRLLEDEDIQKFIKWVKKRPLDFYSSNKDTKKRNSKRKKR